MKALIVDDEQLAREYLSHLLKEKIGFWGTILEAQNGAEAISVVESEKPDVMFLDIEMPDINGIDLLKELPYHPYIIFTTAYDKYAIQAFEKNAIDYLLKPITEERLKIALEKLEHFQNMDLWENKVNNLLSYLGKEKSPLNRIKIKKGDRIFFIEYDEIFYFSSEDKYTFAHTGKGNFIVDYSLQQLEQKLPSHQFFRIHRNTLINLNYLKEIRKWFHGQYVAVLKNHEDDFLLISRRQAQKLLKFI